MREKLCKKKKQSPSPSLTLLQHCCDVLMSVLAYQITGVSIVCSTVCSGANQRTHQSFASLAFVRGIHRWPVNSPHKRPVTRKMFPLNYVIMSLRIILSKRESLRIFCLISECPFMVDRAFILNCTSACIERNCHVHNTSKRFCCNHVIILLTIWWITGYELSLKS